MNFVHAFGFLVVGVISGLLPRWAPGLCATGLDGASTREIWLQVMSAVQVGIAGIYFLGRVGSWLATVMPYTLPEADALAPAAPAAAPVPAARTAPRRVLPLPVAAFEGTLLEQRRAA